MAIPQSVLDEEKKAREMFEQGKPAGNPTDPEKKSAPVENPDDSKEKKEETAPEKKEERKSETPSEPVKPYEPKLAEPIKNGHDKDSEYWKQRFNVIQGKYNAEIPMLQNQLNTLTTQVNYLQTENNTLKKQFDDAKQTENQPKPAEMPDPESFREYGDEFVGMAQMLSQLTNSMKNMSGDIGTMKQANDSIVKETQEVKWSRHAADVNNDPNVIKYNNDPAFINSLQEYNPWTGRTKQEDLNDAHKSMDTARVKAIFKEYANKQPQAQQATEQPKKKAELPISPAKGGAAPSPYTPEGKTYKKADVDKFFKELQFNTFQGTPEDAQAMKADILAAHREGRITI